MDHQHVSLKAMSLRSKNPQPYISMDWTAFQAESQVWDAPYAQIHVSNFVFSLSNWFDKQPTSSEDEKTLQCGQIS